MRKRIILKSISLVVVATFLSHNLTYGLGIQPCSLDPVKQAEVLTVAQKLLYADRGNNSIVQNIISFPFNKGFEGQQFSADKRKVDIRKAPYSADFDVRVDYKHPPEEWKNNPILEKEDLVEALEYFAYNEAHIPKDHLVIREDYFAFKENTLPVDVVLRGEGEKTDYIILIHPEFKKQWEQLRNNDIWFKTNMGEGADSQRTVSVAWGVFYRVAKHIMSDLDGKAFEKGEHKLKGGAGHLWLDEKGIQEVDEDDANKISGRYGIVDEAIWAWFLNVNYGEAARRSNIFFQNRLASILDKESLFFKDLGLYKEFSSLVNDKTKRKAVIAFAYAINYEAYRKNINLKPIKSDPEKDEEYLRYLSGVAYKEIFRGTGIDKSEKPGRRSEDAEKVIAQSMYMITMLKDRGYFTLKDYRIGYDQVQDRLALFKFPEESPDSQLQKDLDVLVERGDLFSEESPGENTRYKIAGKVKTMLAEELNRAMSEELKAGKEASRKQEKLRKLWEDIVRPYFHREPFAFGRRFVFMGGPVDVNEISLKISENRSKARKDVTRYIFAGATLVTAGTAVLFSCQSLPVILVGIGMGWVGGVIFRAAFEEQKNAVELGILFRQYERAIESFAGPASVPQIVETEQIKELMNKYAQTGILNDKNTKEANRIIAAWKAFAGKYGEEKDAFTISDFKQELDKEIEANQSKVNRKVNISVIAITSAVTMLLYGVMHNTLAVVTLAMAPAVLGGLLLVFWGGVKEEGKALSILADHLTNIRDEKLVEKKDKRFKPGRSPEEAYVVICTSKCLEKTIKEQRYFTISDFHEGYNEVKKRYRFADLPLKSPDSQSRRDLDVLVSQGFLTSTPGKATKYFVPAPDWEGTLVTSAEKIERGILMEDVDDAVKSAIDKDQEINEIEKIEFKDSWEGFFGAPSAGRIVNFTQVEKKLNEKVQRTKNTALFSLIAGHGLMIGAIVIAIRMLGLDSAPVARAVPLIMAVVWGMSVAPLLMVVVGLITYWVSWRNAHVQNVFTKLAVYVAQTKEQLESSGPRAEDNRFKPGRSPEDAIRVICKSEILITALRMKGYFTIRDYHSGYNEVREQLQFAPLPQKRPDSQTRRDLEALVGKRFLQVEKKIGSASKYSFPRKQRKEDIGVGTPMENVDEVVKKAIGNNINNDEKAQKKIVQLWEKFLEEPTEGPVDDIEELTATLEDKSIKTKQHAVIGLKTSIAIIGAGGLVSVLAIPNVWTIGGFVVVSGGLIMLMMSMRRFITGGRFAELGAYLEEASVVLGKEVLLKKKSMAVPEEEIQDAAETANELDKELGGPSNGMVPSTGPASGRPEETVIEEISRYIIKVRQENSDVVKDLSRKELKSIWESVNLLHETHIKVFLPQDEVFHLTPAVQRTLTQINKINKEKGRAGHLDLSERFSLQTKGKMDEAKIEDFLNKLQKGSSEKVKKIIVLDPDTKEVLCHYLNRVKNKEALKAFRNVRLLPIAIPEGTMEEEKMTVFQAHVLRTAILARLLEKDSRRFLDIRSQLFEIVENSFISLESPYASADMNFDKFIEKLIKNDDKNADVEHIRSRIRPFLSGKWAVSLIKTMEVELYALKEFWTAA